MEKENKKKFKLKPKFVIALIALCVCVVILAGAVSEYGSVPKSFYESVEAFKAKYVSADDSDWDIPTGDTYVLENNNFKLELDLVTTLFEIEDKERKIKYASFPKEELQIVSEEERARSASNVSLLYYDSSSKGYFMGSGSDSVKKNQFTVKTSGNKIRITYNLGMTSDSLFAPKVVPKEIFETEILDKIESGSAKRSLKLFYDLYSKDKPSKNYEEIAEQYPIVKEMDVYIRTDMVTEMILAEITGYMTDADFTPARYEEIVKDMNLPEEEVSLPPGFTVPIELSLLDDGFSAEVLTDRITENNENDQLTDIYLLEYFSAADETGKGYFLTPDGSGSTIELNRSVPANYVQRYYGDDYAIKMTEQTQLSKNAMLPVYGMVSDKGSYIAMVEGGAAVATLNVKTKGNANSANVAYNIFKIKSVVQTDIGKDRSMPTFNLYSKNKLYEFPKVTYLLLPEGKESVAGMADVYRTKLEARGELAPLAEQADSEDIPLYLDFLCMVSKTSKVLGISSEKKTVLSDFKSIKTIVEELHSKDVTNLRIRLKGWNDGGLFHGAFVSAKPDKAVGTLQELKELISLVESKGGKLFLDTDFTFVSKNKPFDSFKLALDTARFFDKSIASAEGFDLVTLKYSSSYDMRYIISPSAYSKFSSAFLESLNKEGLSSAGLGWSNGSTVLSSDFNNKIDLDRTMSQSYTQTVLESLKNSSGYLISDGANEYALKYTGDIVNLASTSSGYDFEIGHVPFYQMVVSGSINYSGQPINVEGKSDDNLNSIAGAGAPYYLLITSSNKLLKEAGLDRSYYSLNYYDNAKGIAEKYDELNGSLGKVYGQKIIGYHTLEEKVTVTQFEGGMSLVVNRLDTPYDYFGEEVSSLGYLLTKSQEVPNETES